MKNKGIILRRLARLTPEVFVKYCVIRNLLGCFSRITHVLNVVYDWHRCILKMMQFFLLYIDIFLHQILIFDLLNHLLLFPTQLHKISYLLLP